MFEGLEDKEKYGLALGFAIATVAAFSAGSIVSSPTGAFASSNPVSSDTVKQDVQSFMDQQLERQRQQFSMMASQNPNITEDELSVDATVTDVSTSRFGSLQKATVSITGTVPARTGGTQSLDREQRLFVSEDGRYLFQEPTDLQQPQQQRPRQPAR
jgi:hypothetical protein